MKFSLIIESENAVFHPDPSLEVARILTHVERQISAGRTSAKILDLTGNFVGEWKLETFKE